MIRKNRELKEIAETIEKLNNFAIVSHENMDGDAFSSMFALGAALKKLGKNVHLCSEDKLSRNYEFLRSSTNLELEADIPNVENIIVLDVSALDRVNFSEEIGKKKEEGLNIILIDHHKGGGEDKFADYYYVDEESSSCTEVIYEIIRLLGLSIDEDIATCLLAGIISDTSCFVNANTSAKTLAFASELVKNGANKQLIVENVLNNDSFKQIKLRGVVMDRLKFNKKYGIAYSYITYNDFENSIYDPEIATGLANILNTINGVKILFFISEKEHGSIKVSMRTRKENIDLSKFSSKLGGGGHKGAAVFSFKGSLGFLGNKILIKNVDKVLQN